jgi:dipeptidyl aminopeptidase/acylaminoacyl peptidase
MNRKISIVAGAALVMLAAHTANAQKQKMTPELLWELGRVSGESISPDGTSLYYGVTYYNVDENKGNRDIYKIPVNGGKAVKITDMEGSESGLQFHPDGKKLGFIHDGQWWEANLDGSNPIQISDIEGGISGLKYSPDGKMVMYTAEVKIDKTLSEVYPNLPKADAKIIDDLMYRHWDHWEDEYRSHVFIAEYSNGKISNPIDIMQGEPYDCPQQPFGGSEDFIWHPNSKMVAYVSKKLVGVKAAESTNSDIYLYDLDTKQTRNFTRGMDGYDQHPAFSPDGTSLAWLNMSTPGYESDRQVLMVHSLDNTSRVRIGPQWDNSVTGFVWSEDGTKFYINAGENATFQVYEAKSTVIAEADTAVRRITLGDHNIGGIIGVVDGKIFASKTDMNHAAELYSFAISNGKEKQLTTVNDKIYDNLQMSPIEKRWVETIDGKKMLVWVIYPPDFDKNKTYPSLLYCQGGPQSAVSQFYSFRWNFQLMAANGYIVIAPNRRGLPTFGEEWNRSISGDWGGMPMQDYLRAVETMKEEPYIDHRKIGAVGASYGGYSVYMLAGIHGNTFCSFVSHCGLFNLESWYNSTEELFFANFDIGGPYWKNPRPRSYDMFSPHKMVGGWSKPMMVIHGGNDFRVPINQGMEAFQAAKIKGLKSRFLYFPNEGHWVLQPQNGLLWHSEFFKWLDETVKNAEG